MLILAIDPGPEHSGWCLYRHELPVGEVVVAETDYDNEQLLRKIDTIALDADYLVIEQVMNYGMAVGAEVFDTVFWSGRFAQEFGRFHRMPFLEVKLHFCHDSRAKESNVRQAVRDQFPKTGGGKRPDIGTKSQPGPLYGVTGHAWSALALAMAFAAKQENK